MYLNIVSMHAPGSNYGPLNLGLGEPSPIMNSSPEMTFYLEPAEPHISSTNFKKSTNPHLHWHWHGLTQSLLALAHSPSSSNLVSELWLISASTQGLQKDLWPSHKSWQQTCLVSQNQWMLYYRINNLENKILFLSASLEVYRETQFTLDDKDWEHSKEVWWRSGRNQNVSKIGHVCNMLYSIHAYFAHICLNLYWFC